MRTLRILLLALIPASFAMAQITTTSLPNGNVNQFYSAQVTCTNCKGAVWSTSSGLPPGLGISSQNGTISGTPTTAGTYNFQVTERPPNQPGPSSANLSITINSPVSIVTTSVPNAILGAPYSQSLTATGGTQPYSWIIAAGSLPAGLNLSNAGVISGTPTAAGTSTFTVQVFDQMESSAQATFSIVVSAQTTTITTTSLPNGIVNVGYSAQLACSNCANATWALASGTLPQGLNISASGAITGTPTVAGTSNFVVSLTPAATTYRPAPVTQNLSITITPGGLSINESSIPAAFVNTPYTAPLTGSGGSPPYTWTLLSTVNDGLLIGVNTGIISGTPIATGQFALNVQITDSSGSTAMKGFALSVSNSLSILTTSLPNGSPSVLYPTQNLSAGGGQPPYRWTISKGTLPPGLTLDGVFGRISGTPTAAGAYPFTLVVTDNQSNTANANLSITIGNAITIAPSTLPGATVGTAYSQTLTASGGQAPYNWTLTAGTLPAGVTLGAATGVISGTPTTSGTSNFTVTATDSTQATGQAALSIVVSAAPALTITTATLPNGTTGTAYSQTLAVTGGTAPYTWALASGTLPAGLTLNPSTGAITGTPTAAATSNFAVQVTDASKATAQKTLSIVVAAPVAPITVTPTTLPTATVGVAYTQKLTASGGVPPYRFALGLGNLPAGFTFTAATGTISGTATAAETGNFTITVTDSTGATFSDPLALIATNPTTPPVTVSIGGSGSGFSQQLPVTVAIGAAYPVPISGSITLVFAPSVTPTTGVDDTMIQFSSGSRVINFTIPAGSTTPTLTNASSITVLTGTTAGTITLTTDLTANGVDLGRTTKTIVNPSGVPFISTVSFQQTPGGVTVTVIGFSSTRDMVSGTFTFAPATGVSFTQPAVTVQLASAFSTWWSNTAQSNPFGTQFTLTVPFSLSTQSTSVVSVTVTLTNSKGTSNAVSLSQ